VVRHPLVQAVIRAYEKFDAAKEQASQQAREQAHQAPRDAAAVAERLSPESDTPTS
jgi:hypothetical protein